MNGILVISLELELYWGVHDTHPLDSYRVNILGVRQVVPRLLTLFQDVGIHATWATVGFVFFESHQDLRRAVPDRLPAYPQRSSSAYEYLAHLPPHGTEATDPIHYGASLVRLIQQSPGQEIGTHTFSHYRCLEGV